MRSLKKGNIENIGLDRKLESLEKNEKISHIINFINSNTDNVSISRILFPKEKLSIHQLSIILNKISYLIDGLSNIPNGLRYVLIDGTLSSEMAFTSLITGCDIYDLINNVIDNVNNISYTSLYDLNYDVKLNRYEIRLMMSTDYKKLLVENRDIFIDSILNTE